MGLFEAELKENEQIKKMVTIMYLKVLCIKNRFNNNLVYWQETKILI
jgi:hypothetical protein